MKRVLRFVGRLALVLGVWVGVRAAANPLNFHQELAYGEPDGQTLWLNFYPALDQTKPAPLLVFVHGGGWASGSKNALGLGAYELHQAGFALASVEYRLVPKAVYPAQLEDIGQAVDYLRRHAEELNVDGQRLGAWGESAGGHLVSLLALQRPGTLQAVAELYGPTDFLSRDSTTPQGLKYVQGLVGGEPSLLGQASPVTYAHHQAPPFLIMHGEDDSFVPFAQARRLEQVLRKVHAPVECVAVRHADHGFRGHPEPTRQALAQALVDFFERNLKCRPRRPGGKATRTHQEVR